MIELTINGQQLEVDLPTDTPLLYVLRDHIGLTGTKFGCGAALCGACTVHLDGVATRSCVTPIGGAAGVKMLWQHDQSEPIGTWLSVTEDSRGLRVRGKLDLAVARAREALALLKSGALDGLSIGFRTEKSTRHVATGARLLQKIDLWEISLVTFPMVPRARVTSVKIAALARGDLLAKRLRLRARAAALRFELECGAAAASNN